MSAAQSSHTTENYLGLDGIEFVEFVSAEPEKLHRLFTAFGFSRLLEAKAQQTDYYRQNDIHFLLNRSAESGPDDTYASRFARQHGPSISSMGWRVKNAKEALATAISRGARECREGDRKIGGKPVPAIYGIGDSLIYFIDDSSGSRYEKMGFTPLAKPERVADKGFTVIDHLTNNVLEGTMKQWADFYKDVFGFTEVRYFDIRGAKTGLTSYALRSPCGKFCIPINEGTEHKSQINEYLREYKGPGIQHIAFATTDILGSLDKLSGSVIETLDIDDEYYETIYNRVPNVTEDRARIKNHKVLVDGDNDGYLLQIFTKNVVGPIFIEIIQRKNNLSFGEGNFGALFRAIERDQEKRGVL